ncbi:MAG: hypothetical protein NC180_11900 [Muribaculaceae bacterium]|nr:hypothetical protein [Roseburia sp.]MCM1430959.1 hypothetical protein [Muribaculaceae bacterium]MCM1493907.1 hypothetical protein [Muribaculaceae bacterium]
MKRKISICILFFIVIAVSAVLFTSTKKPAQEQAQKPAVPETEETQSAEELVVVSADTVSAREPVYAYVLREREGWVVVYLPDSEQIYMETGIRAESLPGQLKEQLPEGLGFASEAELFDFLESYSS